MSRCAIQILLIMVQAAAQVLKKSGFAADLFAAHELDKKWDGFDKDKVVRIRALG